jgi:hypothetical protein
VSSPNFNLIHILTPNLFKININIILPSVPRSYKFSSFQGLRLIFFFFFSLFISLISDSSNNIWWRIQIRKVFIAQFSLLFVTSVLLGPNVLLSSSFPNALNLCSPLILKGKFSHPYKIRRKCKVVSLFSLKVYSYYVTNEICYNDCE